MFNFKLLWNGLKTAASANSPGICTGVGSVATVATLIGSAKAAWDIRGELGDGEITIKDIIEKGLWKKTIFPIGSAATACFCLFKMNDTLGRVIATGTAYITLREQNYTDQKNAMKKILKKGDFEKVKQEQAKDILARNPQPDEAFIQHTGYGNDLFFDPMTNTYFRATMEHVKSVINDINSENMLDNYPLSWGEVCSKWGFDGGRIAEYIYLHPQADPAYHFELLVVDLTQAHVTDKGEAAVIVDCQNDLNSDFFRLGQK